MGRATISLVSATILLLLASAAAWAAELKVVASIKPVHSLVAAVMWGVGEPDLIVTGGGSPHGYSLKPSQARAIERAQVVFWIGDGLETFLANAIAGLAPDAQVVSLAEAPGIRLLKVREGGVRAAQDDGDAEMSRDAGEAGEYHGDGGDDASGANLHFWLDPAYARAMVESITETLVRADPQHRARYEANRARLAADLAALEAEIKERLDPVRTRPFIVFHDAYQYFERRFGLAAAGSIAVSPDIQPGAARLSELRSLIARRGAVCVFSEPQFEPRHVALVTEGTRAKRAVLDPLGADIEDGPDLYFELMRRNTDAMVSCLTESS